MDGENRSRWTGGIALGGRKSLDVKSMAILPQMGTEFETDQFPVIAVRYFPTCLKVVLEAVEGVEEGRRGTDRTSSMKFTDGRT